MKTNNLFMNLALNVGDTLNAVSIWKVKMTRQDVRPDPKERTLRARLLDKGLAHSFYEEFMWTVPVNGRKSDEINLKETISENFVKWEDAQVEEIEDFTSDILWYPVSLVILRDAIRHALREKLNNQSNLVLYKREIYDRDQIIHSGRYVYVALGVSLEKILRMNNKNVCICPEIVYGCYDSMNIPVDDPYEKQRNILLASRCDSKEYCRRLDVMMEKIFPLNVNLSNKDLKFKSIYYELISEEKEQRGLKQWF